MTDTWSLTPTRIKEDIEVTDTWSLYKGFLWGSGSHCPSNFLQNLVFDLVGKMSFLIVKPCTRIRTDLIGRQPH